MRGETAPPPAKRSVVSRQSSVVSRQSPPIAAQRRVADHAEGADVVLVQRYKMPLNTWRTSTEGYQFRHLRFGNKGTSNCHCACGRSVGYCLGVGIVVLSFIGSPLRTWLKTNDGCPLSRLPSCLFRRAPGHRPTHCSPLNGLSPVVPRSWLKPHLTSERRILGIPHRTLERFFGLFK